jgi:hypothetical protein
MMLKRTSGNEISVGFSGKFSLAAAFWSLQRGSTVSVGKLPGMEWQWSSQDAIIADASHVACFSNDRSAAIVTALKTAV